VKSVEKHISKMDITFIIGMIGVVFGLFVNPLQIYKTLKTKQAKGISAYTYGTLTVALICYTIRAIAIKAPVFIISNSIGIISSVTMLILIYKYKDG